MGPRRREVYDPFSQLMQSHQSMMGGMGPMIGFGGFGGFGSFGFGPMMGGFGGMSPEGMMQTMDQMGGMGQMQGGFHMHSSSFSMSNIGGNVQQYQSHTVSSNMGGTSYSETKQAYSDSSGHEKAGWERHIDNRGHKVVKERRPNARDLTHKTFNNIQPEQEEEFNRQWTSSSQHRLRAEAPCFHSAHGRLDHTPAPLTYNRDDDVTSSPSEPYDDVTIHPSEPSVRIDEITDEGITSSRGPTSRRRQNERRNRIVERQAEPLSARYR